MGITVKADLFLMNVSWVSVDEYLSMDSQSQDIYKPFHWKARGLIASVYVNDFLNVSVCSRVPLM